MRKLVTFLVLYLSLPALAPAADLPQVFQIVADKCSHGSRRVQTGFLADGYSGLITSLHGVFGCDSILARRTTGEKVFDGLIIEDVDIENDAALLRSIDLAAIALVGLPTGSVPPPGAKLRVIGHPQALLVQHRIDLTLESATKYLEDMLPPSQETLQLLLSRASPAVGILVLSLTGDIQPGHSGAPILDAEGRVVGIGNGGLMGGTVGIGWGIPLAQLQLRPKEERQARLAMLQQQNPTLLFDFAVAQEFSFSASPHKTKPGAEVILHFNESIRATYSVYLDKRGPLPRIEEGKKVVITVPGDMASGEYYVEVRQGGRRILSTNKVTVDNWLDTFSFFVTPKRVQTGQKVILHLNHPDAAGRFHIFIKGHYGRIRSRLSRKATLASGSQIVVIVPKDLIDFEAYFELNAEGRQYTAGPVCVDNPNYVSSLPPC
ncbi:MAG: trypsin-like peptidase domain-containing protein [bacterium]|nr:trypsin-like peptidase domain-containing protein [bacterium]